MRLDLQMIVRWDGRLAEVESIAEGRHVFLRFLDEQAVRCPSCGGRRGVWVLEQSPLAEQNIEAVSTVAA